MQSSSTEGNAGPKIRIVIVEDHDLLRAALKQLLGGDPAMEFCGEAEAADDGFCLVCDTRPDLVVVDLSLKHGDGLDLVKRIHDRFPEVRIIVLSIYDPKLVAERALRAGAQGYVSMQEPGEDMLAAIRTVLSDDIYLDEAMTREALLRSQAGNSRPPKSPGRPFATAEIADELHLSQSTKGRCRTATHAGNEVVRDRPSDLGRLRPTWADANQP